jgi:hypothetical protein
VSIIDVHAERGQNQVPRRNLRLLELSTQSPPPVDIKLAVFFFIFGAEVFALLGYCFVSVLFVGL